MSETSSWSHHNPVCVVCAPLDILSKYITAEHVLLVTTPGFVKRGGVQRVKDILATHQVTVWDGVKPNPDLRDLDAATAFLRGLNIGCVVGLGGGSALDAAKVLATTIPSPVEPTLREVFRNKREARWAPRLPLVAIPTTSGTGAEVTPFATVWDHEEHRKHSLAGDFVYPDVALLDATLTLTLGPEETFYPALDAISHALESLWNKNCTPVTRAFAFQALTLSNAALPIVLKTPKNFEARWKLQTASMLAGLAISQTRTAIAHSISYPLTSRFGVPHGLACSYTLPKLLKENIMNLANSTEEMGLLKNTLLMISEFQLSEKLIPYLGSASTTIVRHDILYEDRMENYKGNILNINNIIGLENV